MRNAQLFNELADHFESAPETWDQESWGYTTDCGAFACIAGWACILTDGERCFRRPLPDEVEKDPDLRMCLVASVAPLRAGGLLGLDHFEADVLFAGNWTPHPDLGLPGALRALAEGALVLDVSGYSDSWVSWENADA